MANDLFNNEAEQHIIAAILRNPESYFEINDSDLEADDFANKDHKHIFAAILSAVAQKSDPAVPFVVEFLKSNGHSGSVDYVTGLTSVPCSITQARDYSKVVKSLSVSRKLGHAGADIIEISQELRTDYHGALAEAENVLRNISNSIPEPERSASAGDILKRMELSKVENKVPISWSPTLNSMTGGLTRGHFWAIGGFSSTGKSAIASNMALDAVKAGQSVAIVSAEMTQEQYLVRMLAIDSGIPQQNISGRVTIGLDLQPKLERSKTLLSESPLFIYDNLYRMPQIRTELQRLKNQKGLDVFFLDYIQNVSVTGDEVKDAREVALECQRLAKDLNCTVIAFSQLSNAQAKYELEGGDDNYYALKGHGAIKDAADVVLTLHRDRAGGSSALKVKFRKNRHGNISDFTCRFDLATGRISEFNFEDEDEEF